MANDAVSRGYALASLMMFLLIIVMIAWDVVADFRVGTSWEHIIIELIILLLALVGIGLLSRRLYLAREAVRTLGVDLAKSRAEAERWRQESRVLIQGLSQAIEKQFIRWRLTQAESEIGLLLLKGLSHKELAQVRQTSERTVREQARSLYRKAGLDGRASLSAFFLEELLLDNKQES